MPVGHYEIEIIATLLTEAQPTQDVVNGPSYLGSFYWTLMAHYLVVLKKESRPSPV